MLSKKWIVLGVCVAIVLGLSIFLAVYFGVINKTSESDTVILSTTGRLGSFGPGDVLQVAHHNEEPSEWSLIRPEFPDDLLPLKSFLVFSNGISFQLPFDRDESLVLRRRRAGRADFMDTVIQVRPFLRLKYPIGEDCAPLSPFQSVSFDLDWTYRYAPGQLWAMDLSAYPDMRNSMRLRWSLTGSSDFTVDMNQKRLTLIMPGMDRLPLSSGLYWKLSTLGLRQNAAILSPLPLKVRRQSVSSLSDVFYIESVNLLANEYSNGKPAVLSITCRGSVPEDLSGFRFYYSLDNLGPYSVLSNDEATWLPLIPTSLRKDPSKIIILADTALPDTYQPFYTVRADLPFFQLSVRSSTYAIVTKEPLLTQLLINGSSSSTTFNPSQDIRLTLNWTQSTPLTMFGPLTWEHSFNGGRSWSTVSSPPSNGLMSAQRNSITYSYILPSANVSKYLLRVTYKNTAYLLSPIDVVSASNPQTYVPVAIVVDNPYKGPFDRAQLVNLRLFFTGTWPSVLPVYTFSSNLGALTDVTRLSATNGIAEYTARLPNASGSCTVSVPELSLTAPPISVASGALRSMTLSSVGSTRSIDTGSTVQFEIDLTSSVVPSSIEMKYSVNGGPELSWTPQTNFELTVSDSNVARGTFVIPAANILGPVRSHVTAVARYVGGPVTSHATTVFVVQPTIAYSYPSGNDDELVVSRPGVHAIQSRSCHSLCHITCLKSPSLTFTGSSVGRVKLRGSEQGVYKQVENQICWASNGFLYIAWYVTVRDLTRPPISTYVQTSSPRVQIAYEYTDGSTGYSMIIHHPLSVPLRFHTDFESEPLLGAVTHVTPITNSTKYYNPQLSVVETVPSAGQCFWVPRWVDGSDPRYNGHFAWLKSGQSLKSTRSALFKNYLIPGSNSKLSVVDDEPGRSPSATFTYVYPGQTDGVIMVKRDGSRYTMGTIENNDILTPRITNIPDSGDIYPWISNSQKAWVNRIAQLSA